MIRKPFASLLFLALFASSFSTSADTNAAGDEITIAGSAAQDSTDDGNQDISSSSITSYDNDGLQMDLLLRNPPETAGVTEQKGDLWARIRDGYGMDVLQSPFTATHESWYAARPDYVKRMIARSQRYLYHVVEEVQKRGMPTEVALLPMVESAFNPTAYSTSKASGIWQFVPSTGKNFGLKQNWWKDNRRDITAATDAALNYLEKLHVMFGTWELALAAYNAGEGTVQRAIERNRKKGLPTDYQSLQLPSETRNYVPKLQAVKNIVTNPEQYGLSIPSIPDKPYFTRVEAPAKIDASVAAKLAGVSIDELESLNPAYNRPVLANMSGKKLELLLPVGKDEEFENNLANYDKPLVTWRTYQTRRGERLEGVAAKFHISVAQLREVNNLPAKGRLRPDQALLVPARADDTDSQLVVVENQPAVEIETAAARNARYVVKKGDSIQSIAKRSGMSVKQLVALNNLKSTRLRNGQVLAVAGTARPTVAANSAKAAKATRAAVQVASAKNRSHYTVRRGETLASIAKKLKVAASDLQRWNNLNGKKSLAPGRTLIIIKEDA